MSRCGRQFFVDFSVPHTVECLLAGTGVEVAILFGSAANGKLRPASDIDIGILCSVGKDMGLDEELALGAELERVLRREVDLVRLDTASTLLRFEASRGRCLHEAREGAFADFVARALLEYEDLRPILRRCAEGMFCRLKAAHDQA
jgi:predicted nucleotidyltransferase